MTVTAGHTIQTEPISAQPAPRSRPLGMSLLVLVLAIAVNSLLGPLFTKITDYPLTETLLNQTKGLEAFSLAIITPCCLAAGILALRGHPGAHVRAGRSRRLALITPAQVATSTSRAEAELLACEREPMVSRSLSSSPPSMSARTARDP